MVTLQKNEQLLIFRVGNEHFGIPITDVYEIIFVPQITAVPKSPDSVPGVINVRGQLIPVFDIRIQFLMGSTAPSKQQRIVVTSSCDQVVGLLVDEVTQVLQIDELDLEAVPHSLATERTAYMKGIYKMEDRLVININLDRILDSSEMQFIQNEVV